VKNSKIKGTTIIGAVPYKIPNMDVEPGESGLNGKHEITHGFPP